MLQDKSHTSPWTGTIQGLAEGSLLPEDLTAWVAKAKDGGRG